MAPRTKRRRRRGTQRKRRQRGGALDVQKWIAKTGKELIGLGINTWALGRI